MSASIRPDRLGRGGARAGTGRKPLAAEPTVRKTITLSAGQAARLETIGKGNASEAVRHLLAVTAPDMPLQTVGNIPYAMEQAAASAEARTIYDDLLAFHRRAWDPPHGFANLGGYQSPEDATFGNLTASLHYLTPAARVRWLAWLPDIIG